MKFEFLRTTIKMRVRVTGLFTAAIFTFVNTVAAQLAAPIAIEQKAAFAALIPAEFKIPDSLGSIDVRFSATQSDRPFIAVIQDAHAVVDAQNHIQEIIRHLQDTYGIRVIALEGGQGKLDPTLFRTFPDEFLKKKIMSEYLNRAEITGAEMAAVLNSSEGSYFGIEDWELYEAHYLAYLRAVKNQEAIAKNLEKMRQKLDGERKKVYSSKFNEFHEKLQAFEKENTYLLELLNYLASLGEAKKKFAQYPDLEKLYRSFEFEKETEEKRGNVESLVRHMADSFKAKHLAKMNIKQEMTFHKNYQAFVTGQMETGKFLQYLIAAGESFGVKARLTPAMLKVLGHSQTLGTIKGTKLFGELESLIREIEEGFITNPEEKKITESYRQVKLSEALGKLELTRGQWEEIQAFSVERIDVRLFAPAREFYRLALERDKAFSRNLARLLKKEKANAAIVVAGGFHTEGFERNLKDEGYSYTVITPKIQSLEGQQMYAEVMQGKLSYKSYLKTTFYDAFARDSSLKLVHELNEPDFRKNIKLWRDEIIRRLSSAGRTAEAREYTRYLDLLFKVYHEKFGKGLRTSQSREEILKVIEKELQDFRDDSINRRWQQFQFQVDEFAKGLASLIKQNELNTQNLLTLTEQIRQAAAPSTLNLFSALPAMMPRERPLSRMRPEIREFLVSGRLVAETDVTAATSATIPAAVPTPVMVNALLNQVPGTSETGLIRRLAQTDAVRSEAQRIVEGGDLAARLPGLEARSPENVQPLANQIVARTAEGAARELPNAGPLTAGSAALALALAVGNFLTTRQGQGNQALIDFENDQNLVELNGVRVTEGSLDEVANRSEVRAFDNENFPDRREVMKAERRQRPAAQSRIEVIQETVTNFIGQVKRFYDAKKFSFVANVDPNRNFQNDADNKKSIDQMRGALRLIQEHLFNIRKAGVSEEVAKEIAPLLSESEDLIRSLNGVEITLIGGSETFKGSSDPTKVDPKKTLPGQAAPLKTPSEVAGEMLGKMGFKTPPPKRTEPAKQPTKATEEVYQLAPENENPEQTQPPIEPQIPVESLPSVNEAELTFLEIGDIPYTSRPLPVGDLEVIPPRSPARQPAPVLAPLIPTTINLKPEAEPSGPEINPETDEVSGLKSRIKELVISLARFVRAGRDGAIKRNLDANLQSIRDSVDQLSAEGASVAAMLESIGLNLEEIETNLEQARGNLQVREQTDAIRRVLVAIADLTQQSIELRTSINNTIASGKQEKADEISTEPVSKEEVGLEWLDQDDTAVESAAAEDRDVFIGDLAPDEVGLAPDSAEAPRGEPQTSEEPSLTPEQEMENFIYKYVDALTPASAPPEAESALPETAALSSDEKPVMPDFSKKPKVKKLPPANFTLQFLENFRSGFIEDLNLRDTAIEDKVLNIRERSGYTILAALSLTAMMAVGTFLVVMLGGWIFMQAAGAVITAKIMGKIALVGASAALFLGVALWPWMRPNPRIKLFKNRGLKELLIDQHLQLKKLFEPIESGARYPDERLAFLLILEELSARLRVAVDSELNKGANEDLEAVRDDLKKWPAELKILREYIEKAKTRRKSLGQRLWENLIGGRIRLEFPAPQKVPQSPFDADFIAATVVGLAGIALATFFTHMMGGVFTGIITGFISASVIVWILLSDLREREARIAALQLPKRQTIVARSAKQTEVKPEPPRTVVAPPGTQPKPLPPAAKPAAPAPALKRKTQVVNMNVGGRTLVVSVSDEKGAERLVLSEKTSADDTAFFRQIKPTEGLELKIGASDQADNDFILRGVHMDSTHLVMKYINGRWYLRNLGASGTDLRRKTYLETDGWQPLIVEGIHPLENYVNVLELDGNIPIHTLVNGLKAFLRRRADPAARIPRWANDYIATKQGVPRAEILNQMIRDRKTKADAARLKEQGKIQKEYQSIQQGLNRSPDVQAVLGRGGNIQAYPEEVLMNARTILNDARAQILELDRRAREIGANLSKGNQQVTGWIQRIDQELQRRQAQQRTAEAEQEAKDRKRYGPVMARIIQWSKQKNYDKIMFYVLDAMVKTREREPEKIRMPFKSAAAVSQAIGELDKALKLSPENSLRVLKMLRNTYAPRSEVRAAIKADLTVGGFPIQIVIPEKPLRDTILISSPPEELNINFVRQNVIEGDPKSQITLGRNPEMNILIPDNKRSVSRQHMVLRYINANWYFQSLSETNGVIYQDQTYLKKDGWQSVAADAQPVEDLMNRWELEGIPVATIVEFFQRFLSYTENDYKTIPMAAMYPGELNALASRLNRELGENIVSAFEDPSSIQSLINERLPKAQTETDKIKAKRVSQRLIFDREVRAAQAALSQNKAYQDFIRSDKTMLIPDTPEELESLLTLLQGIRDRMQAIAPEGETPAFINEMEAQIAAIQDEFARDRKRLQDSLAAREKAALDRQKAVEQARNEERYKSQIAGVESWRKNVPYTPDLLADVLDYMIALIKYKNPSIEINLNIAKAVLPLKNVLARFGGNDDDLVLLQTLRNYYQRQNRSEIRFAGIGLEFDFSEEGRQKIVAVLTENPEVQRVSESLSRDFRMRLDEARRNLDGNIVATLEALRESRDVVAEVFSAEFEARIKSQLATSGLLDAVDIESVIWRVRAATLGEAIATITQVDLELADSMQGLSDATLQAFQNKLESALQALKTRASSLRMNIVIVEPDNEADRAYVEFALTQLKEFIETAEVMYAANQKPNSRLRNLGFPVMSRRYDPANAMQTMNDINEKQQALNGQRPVWFDTKGILLQKDLRQPLTALRTKLNAMPENLKKPFITAADRLFIALNGLSASQRQVILGDLTGEKLRQFIEEQQLGFPNTFGMDGGEIVPSISGLIQDLKAFQATAKAA